MRRRASSPIVIVARSAVRPCAFGKSDELWNQSVARGGATLRVFKSSQVKSTRFKFLQCNGLLSAFFDMGFLCGLSIVSV
jgi:hypothetical protein